MKIATFNINSINARLESLLSWLKATSPDIVLLQEIKTEFSGFPFFDLKTIGYDAKVLAQKSYNGVAILSKHKINITAENLPNFADDNARYLEAFVKVKNEDFRIASIYLPNGNPPYNNPDDTSKFTYKLRWMEALYNHAQNLISQNIPTILGGDYNVIITDFDVYNPEAFKNNALCKEEVRQRFKSLEFLGFYDAYRALHPNDSGYTYWDYAGNALNADMGMRIDYLMASPQIMDRLKSCEVDQTPRRALKPSDHTPLVMEII